MSSPNFNGHMHNKHGQWEKSQPSDSPARMPELAFDPSSGRGGAAEWVNEYLRRLEKSYQP